MLDLRTKVSRTVILEKTPPPRTPPTNWQAGLHQLGFPPPSLYLLLRPQPATPSPAIICIISYVSGNLLGFHLNLARISQDGSSDIAK